MRILQDLASCLVFLKQGDQLFKNDDSVPIVREGFNFLMVVRQNSSKESVKIGFASTIPNKFDELADLIVIEIRNSKKRNQDLIVKTLGNSFSCLVFLN